MPPQEPLARPSINPPAIAFAIAYLISLCLIADMNKYIAVIPKKRPNGSDLKHPSSCSSKHPYKSKYRNGCQCAHNCRKCNCKVHERHASSKGLIQICCCYV